MNKKGISALLLVVFLLLSAFIYLNHDTPDSQPPFPYHSVDELPNYSVDEMYAQHSFERDFRGLTLWDLVNKSDINRVRVKVKNESTMEKTFYNTGIYARALYSFYGWDSIIQNNVSCPKNMTPEQFNALIQNVTPQYERIRKNLRQYQETLRELENSITDPAAYALLAWLELQSDLIYPSDVNYEKYAGEYGFSKGVCESLLATPAYYETYVFPYLERGINEVIRLNSKSVGGAPMKEKARRIIQSRGPSLIASIKLANITSRGTFASYGLFGLTYYRFSQNLSSRGFYALGLYYFSMTEAYYNVSMDYAGVPWRFVYPYNISMIRDKAYVEAIDLIHQLHENNFYTLDPFIPEVVLYRFFVIDYTELPKLRDKDSLYPDDPTKIYTYYVNLLVRIRTLRLLHEHLLDP